MSKKIVVFFNGDNTCWDCDAVFRGAQIALLKKFVKAGLIDQASLESLRVVDQALMSKLGRAEYNFSLLPVALYFFYAQHLSVEESVAAAIQGPEIAIAHDAYMAFKAGMEEVAPLFPETVPTIETIRTLENVAATVLFSEGEHGRIERILEAHAIREKGIFNKIILEKKSETIKKAGQTSLQLLHQDQDGEIVIVVVGDSMRGEIKLGNQYGLVTVYKPGPFKGVETPGEQDERPDYTIQNLGELIPILENL